ncbi:28325_t:CDS:2 [Dentiscutata erythropus]|uniref:28325_t:CDS:1 n=1 Tax=Dentiscutata erythropus TaxID=1348616 RepID=A0A9N9AQR2_9GLOM|nr:28325_t:CDS:2 [Dentiscutata erythropus]
MLWIEQQHQDEPTEAYLSSQNLWMIRTHIRRKLDNQTYLIFNQRTGQLFLKNHLHISLGWTKMVGSISEMKTAEEAADLIRLLLIEKQPKQIVVTRKGILDPLEEKKNEKNKKKESTASRNSFGSGKRSSEARKSRIMNLEKKQAVNQCYTVFPEFPTSEQKTTSLSFLMIALIKKKKGTLVRTCILTSLELLGAHRRNV